MSTFHVSLALDYLEGKNRAERTPEALERIVAHLTQTYGLSAEGAALVLAQALTQATQRGWLRA
jgi:hypothetical protein